MYYVTRERERERERERDRERERENFIRNCTAGIPEGLSPSKLVSILSIHIMNDIQKKTYTDKD